MRRSKASKTGDVASALKVAAAIVGIGTVLGAALVIGLDQIMKAVFVDDDWPESEWSSDDWAGEELEN